LYQLLYNRPLNYFFTLGIFILTFCLPAAAQLNYDAVAAYGLRKIVHPYAGNAIRVIRSCDNATADIGFTSCGHLDTASLKTFVIAANPLSAITATAATAYSLRRLNCSYAGNAVRVRSSAAGSPTLDIGFTSNGDLDTAALKTFVGANSAFVTIWYDQSGNSRNAIQATAGSQPRLVNASVVERQGNMPAVRFLGTGCSMSTAAFTTYTAAACFNGVARVSTNVTYNTFVNKTTNNYPAPLDLYNNQMVIGNGVSYNFFSYGQTFNASLPLSIWTYQAAASGSYNFYYNGGSTGSGSVGFYGDNGNPLVLGSRADGVTGLNGYISEVVTFNALPSATDRQFLEWSQGQYYSITGAPALSTLPVSPASASITTWYDQSGSVKDAVQATAANRPLIINAGVIQKNGTIPAISFSGFPKNLVAPLSTAAYPLSLSLMANTSGSSGAGAFVKLGTNVNAGQGGVAIGSGNSGGDFDNSGTSVIGLKEWVSWCPSNPNVSWPATSFLATMIQQSGGGGTSIYVNGTNIPLSNASNAVSGSLAGNLFIGGYTNGSNRYAPVKQSEVIVLSSALSATRRTLLESNQGTYYTITPSNNKYTAPAANAYRLYMNGVGRESATDSVAGTRITTGMGITIGTGATDFLKDNGDYLTYAMDCPTATLSTLNLPATVTQRWYNDWYLNKTDVGSNNGTITFFFDFSDYGFSSPLPGTAANYELLVRNTSSGTFSIVAGTTRSVSGDRILLAVDASNIPTNCYYTVGTRNTSASPLPVELVSFEASCIHNKVVVDWVTSAQYNNDYFSVERSSNGTDFEIVGTLKGGGTLTRKMNYSFIDETPLEGLTYYRLQQYDFDGSQKTYPIRAVTCGGDSEMAPRIYPNPTTGDFTIAGVSPGTQVWIYDQLGLLLYNQTCRQSYQKFFLHLPNGVYFVKVENAPSRPFKLVIQH
jgi:hypothetical protein